MRGGVGCLAILAGLVVSATVPAADLPNPDRGRGLYENHCVVCHTSKVHRRYPQLAIDREALHYIVSVWVEEQNLRWSEEEIRDVVEYLNRNYYRYYQ